MFFWNMNSQKVLKLWNDFWLKNLHKYLPEVNILTSSQDNTTLFNQSWMQQLIPYLAWKPHKLWKKLYNVQKCIRTIDIDEVWDSSHLTFFEMMWNWSLGDYFKKESIKWSYEFLTEYLWIDSRKLSVTVFEWNADSPKDNETYEVWKKLWLSENKICFMDENENWRSPWSIWPCWPDSEIFYRIWDKNWWSEFPPEFSNVKNDEANWMEIWNNVFMEFYRDETWFLTPLKNKNVDTGMWFERIVMVLQDKKTIFETDLFSDLINIVERHLWIKYSWNEKKIRIIVDHIRSSCIIINDWWVVSNTWSWYILRMIIRRMYYNYLLLKNKDSDLDNIDFVNDWFSRFLQDLLLSLWKLLQHHNLNIAKIETVILSEISHFQKTINNWLKMLKNIFKKNIETKNITWLETFKLYDTYGFPVDLTKQIAYDKWFDIDLKWFENEKNKAKQRSKQSTKEMFSRWIDWSKYLEWISSTEFVWYSLTEFVWEDIYILKDFEVDGQRVFILNKTIFYAESWWQKWDNGFIELNNWDRFKVVDVKKYEWVFLHFVE